MAERERVRIHAGSPEHVIHAIQEAIAYANSYKAGANHRHVKLECQAIPVVSFMFTINAAGIEVVAKYLCYRAGAVATFDGLAKSRFACLRSTVDTAYNRLAYQLKHLRTKSDD